jgi:hypothetical protein
MKTTTPAGCDAGTLLSGNAVMSEIEEIVSPKWVQVALFPMAAMGILFITLLNFINKK